MELEINNLQDDVEFRLEFKQLLEKIAQEVEQEEELMNKQVTLALVDKEKIKELNQKYRDKSEVTDVLSFPLEEKDYLGDIAISLEIAKKQAEEYGHSLTRELGFLFLHGLLHLLGYEHYQPKTKKMMRAKEELILNKIGLKR